jgi:hypothetical protein
MPQFPALIELSSLKGSDGFQINGEASYDLSGSSVASAGDINGEGFADFIWFMNGTSFVSGGVASFNPGSAWHVVGSGDFDADGHADILRQNTDGTPGVWLTLTNPGSSWHVLAMAN